MLSSATIIGIIAIILRNYNTLVVVNLLFFWKIFQRAKILDSSLVIKLSKICKMPNVISCKSTQNKSNSCRVTTSSLTSTRQIPDYHARPELSADGPGCGPFPATDGSLPESGVTAIQSVLPFLVYSPYICILGQIYTHPLPPRLHRHVGPTWSGGPTI